MERIGRLLGAAGFVAVLSAALPASLRAQHQHPAPAKPGVAQAADTLASAPTSPSRPRQDSAHVADSLLRVCRPHVTHSIDAYSDCIGTGISRLSSAGNIALALGTLDRIINDDRSLVLLGHPLAHALGYAVRSNPRTASLLLAQCDERYQSGCYHGILQRYFDTRVGLSLAQSVLVAPCDPFRGTDQQFRLFDCLHGTGHGLMMYHAYEAQAALEDCDRLGTEWDRSSCYGGVFMEHIMGARMQTFGEGKVGMHGHATPAATVTLFKPGDLHYPCSATAEKYRKECYTQQADLILPAVKQDYQQASTVCDAAGSANLVRACFSGLGRNASGAAAFGFDGIKRRCSQASPAGVSFCYEGAVRHLAYAPSELSRGIAFCRTLPDEVDRTTCWGGLGLQIGGFYVDLDARRKACESDRPADFAACTNGAGVPRAVREAQQ